MILCPDPSPELLSLLGVVAPFYMYICWIISSALFLMFHPVMEAAIIVPALLMVFPFIYHRFNNRGKDFGMILSMATMPLFWIFIGIWGLLFYHNGPHHTMSEVILLVPAIIFYFFLPYGLFLIWRNRGHRLATTLLYIINAYFLFWFFLYAAMTMSGIWL